MAEHFPAWNIGSTECYRAYGPSRHSSARGTSLTERLLLFAELVVVPSITTSSAKYYKTCDPGRALLCKDQVQWSASSPSQGTLSWALWQVRRGWQHRVPLSPPGLSTMALEPSGPYMHAEGCSFFYRILDPFSYLNTWEEWSSRNQGSTQLETLLDQELYLARSPIQSRTLLGYGLYSNGSPNSGFTTIGVRPLRVPC